MASSRSELKLTNSVPCMKSQAIDVVACSSDKHQLAGHKSDLNALQGQQDVSVKDATTVSQESYSIGKHHERKRDKMRRFREEKGPRIVGAAVTVAMFVFNVVSGCC